MGIKFQWDAGNLKHIIYDHPERNNTVEIVESVILSPLFVRSAPYVENDEVRVDGVGPGTNGKLYNVSFTVRDGAIRPITCHRVSKNSKIRKYHAELKAKGIKA